MGVLSRFFSRGAPQPSAIPTTVDTPFRIDHPVIGFYCPAPALVEQMRADKAALGPLFDAVRESTQDAPKCNVLCVYSRFGPDGSLAHSSTRLRDLIKAAGAHVAIVACENDPDHLFKAVEPDNDWPANIVLTIQRKGEVFVAFFTELFRAMRSGRSMLVAWVELAPQAPGHGHANCPETIMLAEAGHVAFGTNHAYVQ